MKTTSTSPPLASALALALLAALALFAAPPVSAQNTTDAFTPYLNATDLRALAYDGAGTLWIASDGGVLAYHLDAGNWSVYHRLLGTGPRSNDVTTLCLGPSGRVWAGGADRGYTYFDPAAGRWDREGPEDWADPRIRVIRCLGEGIYIGTQAGLTLKPTPSRSDICSEYTPGCEVPSYVINDYALLGDTLWVATQGGLGRFNGETWDPPEALPEGSVGPNARSLAVYEGALWMATAGTVERLVGGGWVTAWDRGAERLVLTGDRLFAVSDGVVYRWDGQQFAPLELSFPDPGSVRDLVRIGNLYFLATDRGLVTSAEGQVQAGERLLPPGPPLGSPVGGISVDGTGTVWAGTREGSIGLMRFDGETWSLQGGAAGITQSWTFSVHADRNGDVWVGHCCCSAPGCPTDLRSIGGVIQVPGLGDVYDFSQDSRDRMWVGTDGFGADVLQQGTGGAWQGILSLRSGAGSELASDLVRAVATVSDGTYFGHLNAGLDYWANHGDLAGGTTASNWVHYGVGGNGLLDLNVQALAASGDNVWVGTKTGLHRYLRGALQERCETRLQGDPGAQPAGVTAIVPDRQGGLWVGTENDGVFYLPRGGQCDGGPGAFVQFTDLDSALPSNDIFSGALNPRDGSVWFGTRNGIVRIDPLAYVGGKPPADRFVIYPNPLDLRPEGTARRIKVGVLLGGVRVQAATRDSLSRPEVFDLAGAKVAEFEEDNRDNSWSWDGANLNGDTVVPGIYFVRTRVGSSEVVVLKVGVVR